MQREEGTKEFKWTKEMRQKRRDREYQRGEMAPHPCFLWVWTMLPLGLLTLSLVMWVRGTGWVSRAAPQRLFLWGFYTSWNMPKTKNCFYFLLYPLSADSCACMLSQFSHGRLFVTLQTITLQASLSMGSSRQEYWSGLPCSSPGGLPNPGIEAMSLICKWVLYH